MKRSFAARFAGALALCALLGAPRTAAAPAVLPETGAVSEGLPCVSAEACIVTDDAGTVLMEKAPDLRMEPASTAKLMTALVAAESCPPDDRITVRREYVETEGSRMYLREGEEVSLEDLLYGLLLTSGNDAALAAAELAAGSVTAFVARMNARAAELGMRDTRFSNPSGLPDGDCYTTARDLARLMAAFSDNELTARISATREAVRAGRTLVNHNRLLNTVAGVDGGKTGYTASAGRCLVSTAARNGRRIFVVTLKDPDDWADHEALIRAAFAMFSPVPLTGYLPVTQALVGGVSPEIRLAPERETELWLTPDERAALRSVTFLRRFEYAPVFAGAAAGKTVFYVGGTRAAEVALRYAESAPTARALGAALGRPSDERFVCRA